MFKFVGLKRPAFFLTFLVIVAGWTACSTPIPSACIGTNIAAGIISLKDTLKLNGECSENAYYFHWDFGDGTSAEEMTVEHVYNKEGVFTITLTTTTKNKTKTDQASIVFSVQK